MFKKKEKIIISKDRVAKFCDAIRLNNQRKNIYPFNEVLFKAAYSDGSFIESRIIIEETSAKLLKKFTHYSGTTDEYIDSINSIRDFLIKIEKISFKNKLWKYSVDVFIATQNKHHRLSSILKENKYASIIEELDGCYNECLALTEEWVADLLIEMSTIGKARNYSRPLADVAYKDGAKIRYSIIFSEGVCRLEYRYVKGDMETGYEVTETSVESFFELLINNSFSVSETTYKIQIYVDCIKEVIPLNDYIKGVKTDSIKKKRDLLLISEFVVLAISYLSKFNDIFNIQIMHIGLSLASILSMMFSIAYIIQYSRKQKHRKEVVEPQKYSSKRALFNIFKDIFLLPLVFVQFAISIIKITNCTNEVILISLIILEIIAMLCCLFAIIIFLVDTIKKLKNNKQ